MVKPEVTTQINAGTVVTIGIFLAAQTIAGVWWAATLTADVKASRTWQMRQDDRLQLLEYKMDSVIVNSSDTRRLLNDMGNNNGPRTNQHNVPSGTFRNE